MSDLLRMDFINSLPHPLFAKLHGSEWPVYDICVETGLMRIDACGMLDVLHIGDAFSFKDANGIEYDVDMFYSDYQPD